MTVTMRVSDLTMSHNLDVYEELFKRAPREAAFEMARYVGRSFVKWNSTLRRTTTKAGRKMAKRGAFTFKLTPTDRENKQKTNVFINRIKGEFRTNSEVVLAHEFGAENIRATRAKFLTIPQGRFKKIEIRRAEGLESAAEYNQASDNRLFPVIKKRGGGASVWLARLKGEKTKKGKERLEYVFALRSSVDIKPTLGMFDTWNDLRAYRADRLKLHIGNIAQKLITVTSIKVLGRAA